MTIPSIVSLDRSDPVVIERLAGVQRICLAIVMLVAAATLSAWTLTDLGLNLPPVFTLMKVNTALGLLASAVGLTLSLPPCSRHSLLLSRMLAIPIALLAGTSLLEHAFNISLRLDTLFAADPGSFHPGLMSVQSGSSLLLIALILIFIRAERGVPRYIADAAVAILSFLVLVLLSGFLFGATSPLHVAIKNWTAPQTLISLGLLSFVAFAQRAEYGSFAILVRRGIGGRTARVLTPILLILPFLRELGRARLIRNPLLPEHYTTAILASMAAGLSLALLIALARYINRMEKEIHDLSLRDGLTGLYNLRGFQLLAAQGLRLANRERLPFSVLYVDLDNLKQINDQLGHETGSEFLVETAVMLQSTFRETDVIARIGGDEFVVAGQFSQEGIAAAALRLQEESSAATPVEHSNFPLSFSLGYATTAPRGHESLDDLMARADEAMYKQKKSRKLQPR